MDTTENRSLQSIGNDSASSKPYPSAPQLQLQLATVLQTTLDIETLLQLFYEEIADNLNITGLIYVNRNERIEIELGLKAQVNCSYRLSTPENRLGELKFFLNKPPQESLLKLLEISIASLLYPMKNALTYREVLQTAHTDQLTGAGNRAALDNTLKRQINLSKRHEQPLSILAIDIDWFKNINDTYGHVAGDEVLQCLVKTIAQPSRSTDQTFRYGGEEFVVLLHNTSPVGAAVIAERVRLAIEEQTVIVDGEAIKITISVGTATLNTGDTAKSFFNRADRALYTAKRSGRNQVSCSEQDVKTTETV
ncbi:MAG: GGDEF domain-containing protein [Pseudomonadales bacterium]|nr:GGDEF domain-containing protein [Pseudomonadales bacterium]